MPPDLPTANVMGQSLIEIPFPQVTPTCVSLTQTLTSTSGLHPSTEEEKEEKEETEEEEGEEVGGRRGSQAQSEGKMTLPLFSRNICLA